MTCKRCSSSHNHDSALGCVAYLKSRMAAQKRHETSLVRQIASLKAQLSIAHEPLPRESTDPLRVVQAMEHRVQVLEAEFRAHVEHQLRPLGAVSAHVPAETKYCFWCGQPIPVDNECSLGGEISCRRCWVKVMGAKPTPAPDVKPEVAVDTGMCHDCCAEITGVKWRLQNRIVCDACAQARVRDIKTPALSAEKEKP